MFLSKFFVSKDGKNKEQDDEDDEDDAKNRLPTIKIGWEPDQRETIRIARETARRRRQFRKQIAQEYPFLNDSHIELLGCIDDAIDARIPIVRIPRLRLMNDRNRIVSRRDMWTILKLPTITCVLSASVAFVVIYWENRALGRFYPFVATLIAFFASMPAVVGRYDGYWDKLQTGLKAAQDLIDPALTRLEEQAKDVVVAARKEVNDFLDTVHRKRRRWIRQIGGSHKKTLDALLPPVSDLHGYLDQSEDHIRQSIEEAKAEVKVDRLVSWKVVQSKRTYRMALVMPILIVMLAMQVLCTWRMGQALDPTIQDRDEDGTPVSKWGPLIVVLQTFVVAVAQTMFAYVVTRKKQVLGFVNRQTHRINRDVNRYVHDHVGKVFHQWLDVAMRTVRKRILEVVQQVRKAEATLVDTSAKAHDVQAALHHATGQVKVVETALKENNVLPIDTNQKLSGWLESMSEGLNWMIVRLDEATAGLIDCTGFVQERVESPSMPPNTTSTMTSSKKEEEQSMASANTEKDSDDGDESP